MLATDKSQASESLHPHPHGQPGQQWVYFYGCKVIGGSSLPTSFCLHHYWFLKVVGCCREELQQAHLYGCKPSPSSKLAAPILVLLCTSINKAYIPTCWDQRMPNATSAILLPMCVVTEFCKLPREQFLHRMVFIEIFSSKRKRHHDKPNTYIKPWLWFLSWSDLLMHRKQQQQQNLKQPEDTR